MSSMENQTTLLLESVKFLDERKALFDEGQSETALVSGEICKHFSQDWRIWRLNPQVGHEWDMFRYVQIVFLYVFVIDKYRNDMERPVFMM